MGGTQGTTLMVNGADYLDTVMELTVHRGFGGTLSLQHVSK